MSRGSSLAHVPPRARHREPRRRREKPAEQPDALPDEERRAPASDEGRDGDERPRARPRPFAGRAQSRQRRDHHDADGVAVWPEPGNPQSVWNVGINELNGQLELFSGNGRAEPDVNKFEQGRDFASVPQLFLNRGEE